MPNSEQIPEIRVLVLSGGLGSRSENPSLPKILQKLGPNFDLARMHLTNLSDAGFVKVTFLLGKGAPEVIERLEELMTFYPKLEVSWLIDEGITGTTSSVINAVSKLDGDEFLLILGDTAVQGSLLNFVERAKQCNGEIVLASHPNLHPLDSDRVIADERAKVVVFAKKNSPPIDTQGVFRALTGLLFFRKSLLKNKYSEPPEADVTSHLLSLGMAAARHIPSIALSI